MSGAKRKPVTHLHGFGEPMLDKLLPDKIQLAKTYGIKRTYLVSNASLLSPETSRKIISAGLDKMKRDNPRLILPYLPNETNHAKTEEFHEPIEFSLRRATVVAGWSRSTLPGFKFSTRAAASAAAIGLQPDGARRLPADPRVSKPAEFSLGS